MVGGAFNVLHPIHMALARGAFLGAFLVERPEPTQGSFEFGEACALRPSIAPLNRPFLLHRHHYQQFLLTPVILYDGSGWIEVGPAA